jgi:hypothetical protein
MTSENRGDGASNGFAFALGKFVWKYWTAFVFLSALILYFIFGFLNDTGAFSSVFSADKAENINIVGIGGWNIWWFIAFWMLSQCILVHYARRGSKQQG